MTLFSTLGQGGAFLGFLLIGMACGVLFDVAKGICMVLKGKVVRFALDVVCFVASAGLVCFALSFLARIRLFVPLAVCLGFVIERLSLSILLANFLAFVYNKAREAKNAIARRRNQNEKQHGGGTDA